MNNKVHTLVKVGDHHFMISQLRDHEFGSGCNKCFFFAPGKECPMIKDPRDPTMAIPACNYSNDSQKGYLKQYYKKEIEGHKVINAINQ